MKDYKIFWHPDGRLEPVKQGWSWPAFFFSWIWALVKKMWTFGAGMGVALLFVNAFGTVLRMSADPLTALLTELILTTLAIALSILFGLKGNQWREANLIVRGWEHVATKTAPSHEAATAIYIRDHVKQKA